jgi:hypothetical protein
MEVDEDYDDSGEDEKKTAAVTTNGTGAAPAASDSKAPASTGTNGIAGPTPKVEP